MTNVGKICRSGGVLPLADPGSTGQVMQFRAKAATSFDLTTRPMDLVLPAIGSLGFENTVRSFTLNEEVYEPADVPSAALLGTLTDGPLLWMDPITENPMVGDIEVWDIHNSTEDAHPIHVHQVMFQVLGRGADGTTAPQFWERGWKDEDNEMMRPYRVG